MYRILFLLFFLLINSGLIAQDYMASVTQYNEEDGLSHNQVFWTTKDSQGMIWLGTPNGLNRFDGRDFEFVEELRFFWKDGNRIVDDYEGYLWLEILHPNPELVFYNTKKEKIETLQERFGNEAPFTPSEFYGAIRCQQQGMTIGTNTGHLVFYDSTQQFTSVKIKDDVVVEPLYETSDRKIWLLLKQYINVDFLGHKEFVLVDRNGTIEQRIPIPDPGRASDAVGLNKSDHFICHIDGQMMEMATDGELETWSLETATGGLVTLAANARLSYDADLDLFWYTTKNHIFIFHKEKGVLVNVTEEHKDLGVSHFYDTYLDDDQNCWLGTLNGYYKINLNRNYFQHLFYKPPGQYQQSEFYSCRGITKDEQGKLYVNTNTCTYELDGAQEKVACNDHNFQVSHYDPRGYIWKSSYPFLIQKSLTTGEERKYRVDKEAEKEPIWSVYLDKNNRLWCGTYRGLQYLDEGSDSLQIFDGYNEFKPTARGAIYDIYEDRNGRIWVVSIDGLFELDLEKGIVDRFWPGEDSTHYIASRDLRHIYQDEEEIFWIASSQGLIRWDEKKRIQQHFAVNDGLSSNNISAIYEDDYGFLWMSSDKGIMQFDRKSHQVKTYLTTDGITHNEFNPISHFQDEQGNIYFGGLNGITYFHPRDFVKQFDSAPDIPLVLTNCQLFSAKSNKQENRMAEYQKEGRILMSPGDRYLNLRFALLDYNYTQAIQYDYRMSGEEVWSQGEENSLRIAGLPYGKQLLEIRGKTINGSYSSQILTIPIFVQKPFYLQAWFIVFGLLLLAGFVFLYQKMKTKKLMERQKELEETVAERTHTIQEQAMNLLELNKTKSRFLANISHELRTPLTLILTATENVDEKINQEGIQHLEGLVRNDLSILKRNSGRLQNLIEQLLNLSKLENGKMELQLSQEDFHQYLKELVSSFIPIATKKKIDLQFTSTIANLNFHFDRDKMDKIVYNLLYNAIKFTPEGGVVILSLQRRESEVFVSVSDTGIGIAEEDLGKIFTRFYQVETEDEYAHEGTGLGLTMVKEFTELHQGVINVSSVLGEGTTFQLSFPIVKSVEKTITPKEQLTTTKRKQLVGEELMEEPFVEEIETPEKPILLFIEDNEDLRYYQQKKFESEYSVHLAKNGLEGLEMAYQHIPDVIICDVMMPGKDGYEVSTLLKSDERTNHIPIILLTAKASQEEKIEGLTIGVEEYMIKPYDQKELALRIDNLLQQTKRLQQRYSVNRAVKEVSTTVEVPQNPFLQRMEAVIEENITNTNFGIQELSESLKLSRSQLFRKLKALTGTTPTNYLRSYRLQKAKELLLDYSGNASEVSYMVGFKNPSYFFKCFKDEFGMTPSELMKGVESEI